MNCWLILKGCMPSFLHSWQLPNYITYTLRYSYWKCTVFAYVFISFAGNRRSEMWIWLLLSSESFWFMQVVLYLFVYQLGSWACISLDLDPTLSSCTLLQGSTCLLRSMTNWSVCCIVFYCRRPWKWFHCMEFGVVLLYGAWIGSTVCCLNRTVWCRNRVASSPGPF